ncbi:ribonuclease H-like domain-containing protein [Tanacetum coccineum]|uniref:Ribonuclease H-like domain-containing protein n=1 Tax=Tanacetum coccineum TaxID=301880 RepID=A0ABQ4XJE3_9ASTR
MSNMAPQSVNSLRNHGPCGYITFGDLAKQVPKSYITLCKIRPYILSTAVYGYELESKEAHFIYSTDFHSGFYQISERDEESLKNLKDIKCCLLAKKQSRRTLFTKEIDLETTQTNAVVKLPWQGPVTTEEKAQKKNDVKARCMLLMALPNEHQLTFNQYKDAKTLFAAIQTRFGGNDATKKTQKTLLKQSYENFNSPSTESLPSEWNTHVVVWRNKPDLETMSFDDLYNNFKIVEQEVKRTGTSSLNSSFQNMAFVLTLGSTNEANTVNVQVITTNSSVSTDSTLDSTANLKIDLKWQLALLSVRARKYYQRTGNKITINRSDTAGYEKSKVECFNCHKMVHFARECRGPRNQERRPSNQDSSRRIVNVEDTSSKAMVAIDGVGFDWSFMAEEEVTTNMALMAFSDSEFNKSVFNLASYKRGLASIEEQLFFYKKNEVMFCDQIVVLKRDASFKDSEINALKIEIEKLKNEKESNQIKINKFENASKSLDKLIGSQISDNSRKGVGYNVVPPPPTGLFAPSIIDLSYSGLEEFQQPEFEGYGPKSVCVDTSNEVKKTSDTPLVEELVSEKEKQTVFPKQQDKTARKPVKYAEMYRSQKPRGNQRNWNNLKSQQLGSDFVMYNKACFVCGSFDHIQAHCKYHQREMMVYGNNYNRVNYNYTTNMTHPNAQRNMVPRVVLMKTGLKPFNTSRTVNTALPKSIAQAVNTARPKAVNTARPKAINTARPNSAVVNTVRANQANVVKASACWGNPLTDDQGYVDSGCSRHITSNNSYLLDFQEFNGGYVTFGGGVKGGKITGKGTLKMGKLDFQDVYFVKELQFNHLSVSQMCDKKKCVLFTDTACFVLSLDFNLLDESQILLKIPRKNNMYNVDTKNIVPKESLTCLVAKATLDESIFTWVFFLASKDETSGILKIFITEIENLADKKLKIIRCDNETEFKNRVMNEFCEKKVIKREYSIARTPQQNGVAEKRN